MPRPGQALAIGRPGFVENAKREPLGRLDERGVVHERERGQWRVADRPLRGALLAGRRVERAKHRVQELPLPVHVNGHAGTG